MRSKPQTLATTVLPFALIRIAAAFAVLAGLSFDQPALALAGALALFFPGLCWLWTAQVATRFRAEIALERTRLFPGETTKVDIVLANPSRVPARASFRLDSTGNGIATLVAEEPGLESEGADGSVPISNPEGPVPLSGMKASDTPTGSDAPAVGEAGISGSFPGQAAGRRRDGLRTESQDGSEQSDLQEGPGGRIFDGTLGAGRVLTLALPVRALRRGVWRTGEARASAGDPFGLYRAEPASVPHAELLVYPRVFEMSTAAYPTLGFQGSPSRKARMEDPAFQAGVRDYAGDLPAKAIDWKASARRDRLQVKLFEATARRDVCLVLDAGGFGPDNDESTSLAESRTGTAGGADDNASESPETALGAQDRETMFEHLIEVAASLALAFERESADLSFVTNARMAGALDPAGHRKRGAGSLGEILETMARLEMHEEADLGKILLAATKLHRPSTFIYLGRSCGAQALHLSRTMARVPGSACVFIVAQSPDTTGTGQATAGQGLVVIPLSSIHPLAVQHG